MCQSTAMLLKLILGLSEQSMTRYHVNFTTITFINIISSQEDLFSSQRLIPPITAATFFPCNFLLHSPFGYFRSTLRAIGRLLRQVTGHYRNIRARKADHAVARSYSRLGKQRRRVTVHADPRTEMVQSIRCCRRRVIVQPRRRRRRLYEVRRRPTRTVNGKSSAPLPTTAIHLANMAARDIGHARSTVARISIRLMHGSRSNLQRCPTKASCGAESHR